MLHLSLRTWRMLFSVATIISMVMLAKKLSAWMTLMNLSYSFWKDTSEPDARYF